MRCSVRINLQHINHLALTSGLGKHIMVVMAYRGLTYLWHGKKLPEADIQYPGCPAHHATTQSKGLACRSQNA